MDCVFCKIIAGEIPSSLVYQDDTLVAFNDIQPQAPVHLLVVPKRHIPSMNAMREQDAELLGHIFLIARRLAKQHGLEEKGYRLVNNCGADGGQAVFHFHVHLLGGRAMEWPPG